MQAKTRLYEASMQKGQVDTAVLGLISIRSVISKNTRTFLEATALLAICYLRLKDLQKAEPLIKEVLINDKVISSEQKRVMFRKNIIERFDEEGLLFALRGEQPHERFNYVEIENEAIELIKTNKYDDELFENIGNMVPPSAKNVLLQVDQFSKKQLPTAERIALPSGNQIVDSKKVGKTLFKSIRRTIYKSICDKDSEVYKSWYAGSFTGITSLISVIVADAFHSLNIAVKTLVVTVTALILKFGLNVYCEHYKPNDMIALR